MPDEPQQPKVKFPWTKPKDKEVPQIYGNYFNVSWTLFDVRFIVAQLVPENADSNNFLAEERAAITLAWPEVKALRDAAIDLVARYEKTNGEIKPVKLPPNTPLDQM